MPGPWKRRQFSRNLVGSHKIIEKNTLARGDLDIRGLDFIVVTCKEKENCYASANDNVVF